MHESLRPGDVKPFSKSLLLWLAEEVREIADLGLGDLAGSRLWNLIERPLYNLGVTPAIPAREVRP